MAQLKSSGGAPGWADTVADYHQKIISATHPDIRFPLEIDELQGLSSASGKLSERVKALDRTGQLTERTKPKFTGSFSEVSQAKLGDLVVAVKTLRVANTEGDEDRIWKRLAREIYVWAGLDHPNVLVLLGFAIDYGKPCLISPWCDNGTLQEYLHKFPDADRRRLVRDIADGLRYLHLQTPPIIHGDLKMISDFGGSKRAEQLRTGFTTDGLVLATTRFTSPEILRDGQKPSLSSDVFSFACVTLETMTGKCPFWKITNVVGVITQVVSKKQTPSQEDHPGMEEASWELLRRCWNYEPSDRPHMVDVCNMLSAAGYGPFTRLYPPTPTGPSTATFVQT
ncbi:hypothetical protein FS837_012784 [Tulasnella sp. UAMH 9824]|nr:hypothetical protein FS837_012784 [Tulasnella sp. UAMH 9824]